jgi:hypothetical protein
VSSSEVYSPVTAEVSQESLTPVQDPTKRRSASFSLNESGAKLYQSLRKTYSFSDRATYEEATLRGTRLFDKADLISPVPEASSIEVDNSASVDIEAHSASFLDDPTDGSYEQTAADEEDASEAQEETKSEAAEVGATSEDAAVAAALYNKYKTAWSDPAASSSQSMPLYKTTSVAFGSKRESKGLHAFKKDSRRTAFDRLHDAHGVRLSKQRALAEEQRSRREREEVAELYNPFELGAQSRLLTAGSKLGNEGGTFLLQLSVQVV